MTKPDPFRILAPQERWAPGQEQLSLHGNDSTMLLPPLVQKIRMEV